MRVSRASEEFLNNIYIISAVGNYACFKNTYTFHRDPRLCEGLNALKIYISQSNLIYFY